MNAITINLTTADIEGLFLEWLQGQTMPLTLPDFQTVLAESDSKLPEEVCLLSGLPVGSTMGHAARSLISVFDQRGVEHRLDLKINFRNEEDSLRWWRNNRDNPNRIRLTRQGDGRYSLEIAPITGPVKANWQDGF